MLRTWLALASLVFGFAVLAIPSSSARAAEVCREVFVPPDSIKVICEEVVDCSSPNLSQRDLEFCGSEVCSRPENQTKRFCQDLLRCGSDEKRVGDRCEPLNCGPDQMPSSGRCVPLREPMRRMMAQRPQCIDQKTFNTVVELREDSETVTEARLENIIALSIVRLNDVEIPPDGRVIALPPRDTSPQAQQLAATVNKFTKSREIDCDPGVMSSCTEPLTGLIEKQTEAGKALILRLFKLGDSIDKSPQYSACVAAKDPRTLRYIEATRGVGELVERAKLIDRFFESVRNAVERSIVTCPAPDVRTCDIRFLANPPAIPNRGFAKRKLNNPK